ncbi:2-hydroxychromene-2-carboxylate isomerase [Sandaracinobacter neustonicus]|uniref:2-hydroxychromene-2-carboxylate isomerase n=2 Tax=Sandaracinobacter neustonicus TaxID=1715348 RepID=A0A501XVP8_9SPHN|nr:2-hydroxychromene-2-carboxylate isomerase [Sandaracinobacter neustonicus]
MVRSQPMDVTFWFDFGSPNAWFAHQLIPGIEARTGATFTYVPVLLGGIFKATGNQAPMLAFANVPAKIAYQGREMQRFIRRHGLQRFTMNPHFPVNTLALMRGAVAAESIGLLKPYVDAMLPYMWERPRKLDDPAILAETLAEAGLPAEQILVLSQDPAIKERLVANTQAAVDKGVFGIPSFLVGEELFFGKDSLADLEAELRELAA